MQSDYDCAIIGAGMVGATLAIALGSIGLRIAVVDARVAPTQPDADQRGLALALSTFRIFTALDLWPELAPVVTPIRRIHVSDQGRFGFAEFRAGDIDVDALAYVCPAGQLATSLRQRMRALPGCAEFSPAVPVAVQAHADRIDTCLSVAGNTTELTSRLLIAADGIESGTRTLLGLEAQTHDYRRSAVVATIRVARPQPDTAFERFTARGPIALLPAGSDRYVSVWTNPQDEVEAVHALPDDVYADRLGALFGDRLGRFDAPGPRRAYPLRLSRAIGRPVARSAVIGNAATAVHPNAAQGLNLGLRDVAALADCLADAVSAGADIGAPAVIDAFRERRRGDRARVAQFTDTLAQVFASDFLPIVMGRDLAMLAIDLIPPLKREFIRRATGIAGARDRLTRGLPLGHAGDGGPR